MTVFAVEWVPAFVEWAAGSAVVWAAAERATASPVERAAAFAM